LTIDTEVLKKNSRSISILLLAIPLALSAFTHIWNGVQFPSIHHDEALYTERAVRVLQGLGPQNPTDRYDHPFFAQYFMAGVFKLIGYPNSLNPHPGDVHSIEMLYLVPRVLMGILSVADTFLIYKIAEYRYNRKVAFIASILFAVMPLTWITRRIFLESIQLPFLLSSILFAVYLNTQNSNMTKNMSNKRTSKKTISLVLLSGIFLGVAIFTKIPAFSMIPLIGYLVFSASKNNLNSSVSNKDASKYKMLKPKLKILGLWLVPVILIPTIWPLYAISIGEFDEWLSAERGVLWQFHRVSKPLFDSITSISEIDPILFYLGFAGIIFSLNRKDFLFVLLWIIPFFIFEYVINFVSYWHLVPIIPLLCIALSSLIVKLSDKISSKKRLKQILPFAVTSVVGIIGLASFAMIIVINVNTNYFDALAQIVQYLPHNNNQNNSNGKHEITIISGPRYVWIPKYIFDENYSYRSYGSRLPVETSKMMAVVDTGFRQELPTNKVAKGIFNDTSLMAEFSHPTAEYNDNVYPYTIMKNTFPDSKIQIRSNFKR
jgi:hypothetical protein